MKREQIIQTIRRTLKRHGVRKAYLFGSFARGEKKYHDIDIAITPPAGKFSLLDLVGLEQEMEGATAKKIDLMTLRSIRPAFKPYIKKDLTAII
jgi:predicted nucleotidyltransferase